MAGAVCVVVLALCGLAGCTRQWHPATEPHGMVRATFEYSPGYSLDVLTPAADANGPLPVFVLMHGCCGSRADMATFADGLAASGAVVFNVDWTGISAGGYPLGYEQAACAVRTASAFAGRFGGDPKAVALVGWSDGAMVGAVAALNAAQLSGACLVSGTAEPKAFVGIAGFYGWPLDAAGQIHPTPLSSSVRAFFGGTPQTAPDAWAQGNPFTVLAQRPELIIRLIVSSHDALRFNNRDFAAAARAHCHDVTLTIVDYQEDFSLITSRTPEGQTTIRTTMGALTDPAEADPTPAATIC
ncbi:alpha/beta hydrolase [Pseudofrankia inefficax]|nr:alpha/beta hydrolase [Pseudofrankia inefficax]